MPISIQFNEFIARPPLGSLWTVNSLNSLRYRRWRNSLRPLSYHRYKEIRMLCRSFSFVIRLFNFTIKRNYTPSSHLNDERKILLFQLVHHWQTYPFHVQSHINLLSFHWASLSSIMSNFRLSRIILSVVYNIKLNNLLQKCWIVLRHWPHPIPYLLLPYRINSIEGSKKMLFLNSTSRKKSSPQENWQISNSWNSQPLWYSSKEWRRWHNLYKRLNILVGRRK